MPGHLSHMFYNLNTILKQNDNLYMMKTVTIYEGEN